MEALRLPSGGLIRLKRVWHDTGKGQQFYRHIKTGEGGDGVKISNVRPALIKRDFHLKELKPVI